MKIEKGNIFNVGISSSSSWSSSFALCSSTFYIATIATTIMICLWNCIHLITTMIFMFSEHCSCIIIVIIPTMKKEEWVHRRALSTLTYPINPLFTATLVTIIIIIPIVIITRPKTAYGQQGLAGSSLFASGAQLRWIGSDHFPCHTNTHRHFIIIYISSSSSFQSSSSLHPSKPSSLQMCSSSTSNIIAPHCFFSANKIWSHLQFTETALGFVQ